MSAQNLKTHTRIEPLYHYVLYLVLLFCLILSVWAVVRAYHHQSGRLIAATALVLNAGLILTAYFTRHFALVAQDRAIRAEESLRYFVLNGKLPDSRLTVQQIIALRFAEDTEFTLLAERAVKDQLSPKEIKKSIINWRPDEYRV